MILRRFIVSSAAIVLMSGVVGRPAAAQCLPDVPYPGTDWPDATAATAASKSAAIATLEKYMFTIQGTDAQRLGIRTDGLLIIQNGELIYERYGRTFAAGNRHDSWSVSKSITGALVGIATQHGVSVDDSVCKYLPQLTAATCAVKIRHLMEMSAGFQWDELYENESNQYSSVLATLYGEGHKDMSTFVGDHALANPPGTVWEYSTGNGILLAGAMDAAMKPVLGDRWEWTAFFNVIGMNNAIFERDAANRSVGGSLVFSRPRDLARFGYLYLNNGCWNGQQLLPAGWVQYAQQLSPPMGLGKTLDRGPTDVYGHLWWLNIPVAALGLTAPPYPDVPQDAFFAEGHWGQYIVVIPSKHMVIVRTGDERDSTALDVDTFVKDAMAVGQ